MTSVGFAESSVNSELDSISNTLFPNGRWPFSRIETPVVTELPVAKHDANKRLLLRCRSACSAPPSLGLVLRGDRMMSLDSTANQLPGHTTKPLFSKHLRAGPVDTAGCILYPDCLEQCANVVTTAGGRCSDWQGVRVVLNPPRGQSMQATCRTPAGFTAPCGPWRLIEV